MKDQTIVVEGRGRLAIEPDAVQVEASVAVVDLSYSAANTEVSRSIRRLREAAVLAGFARTDFKTTDFGVTRESQYVGEPRRTRFMGYRIRHSVELQFPLDQDRLNRLVEACQATEAEARIEVRFILTEPDAARNRSLATAVADAGRRAEALTRAAGMTLGEVIQINHVVTESRSQPEPRVKDDEAPLGPALEASAFVVEERVQITWKILGG